MPISKRPGAVTAIAVLHFVFGGLDIVGALCGIGLAVMVVAMVPGLPAVPGQVGPKEMLQILDRNSPTMKWYMVGFITEALVAGVLMVTAGVGLLRMRYWGRSLTIVYAIISILWTLSSTVYGIAVMQPEMLRAQKEILKRQEEEQKNRQPGAPAPPPPAFGGMGGGSPTANAISSIIQQAIYLAYPVAVLIIMMLKSVRHAFAVANGDAPAPAPDEPKDDLDWDRPMRERDDLDEPPHAGDVTSFRPK
jgi:hypothetical protein